MLLLGLSPADGASWLWDHGPKHGTLTVLGTLAYAAAGLLVLKAETRTERLDGGREKMVLRRFAGQAMEPIP